MKINLVFSDWRDSEGNRVYFTGAGAQLSAGDFHAGTTFSCEIDLDEDSAADLRDALEAGYVPVFYAVRRMSSGGDWARLELRLDAGKEK
jgi:hypothetical protein